jgi:hypothetical protein
MEFGKIISQKGRRISAPGIIRKNEKGINLKISFLI